MIDILRGAIELLPIWLNKFERWSSLDIDYTRPRVERLWTQWGDNRVYIHLIHPCTYGLSLYHPHPWPSAVRILAGSYRMGVGHGNYHVNPPEDSAAVMFLGPGSEYAMNNPNGWHFVEPTSGPVLSVMVTGKPWKRTMPKSTLPRYPLARLSDQRTAQLLEMTRLVLSA